MKHNAYERPRGDSTVTAPSFDEVYPIIRRVAGVRAANVAKAYGLSTEERSDLEQEAALHVWRGLGAFDPTRASLKTFVERIVSNQMLSSIRRLRAEKRQAQPDACASDHIDSGVASVNLRIDVLRVIKNLRPEHQDICRMLSDHSAVEVSRRTGISRATVYRMIGHLRVAFTEAGLQGAAGQGARW